MRQIKQITGAMNTLYALCDDETLWFMSPTDGRWVQHHGIPQPKADLPVSPVPNPDIPKTLSEGKHDYPKDIAVNFITRPPTDQL